jgi:nitroimidazol reductase NimA-like FMN-containing flavoprotein (pyridoxamine 5'-phosphate oxidase superfamily)
MPSAYEPTRATRLRRLPERGRYDRDTVHAILDEGFICHVAFTVDGRPTAVPTGYARVGDTLYLHGSSGSRLGLVPGMDVCVTVTLVDGLVLAKSSFHHSFNYRSVMALGRTRLVDDPEEKAAALDAVVEHIVPGRTAAVRGGDRKELAATVVLAVELDEVSAKVRTGGPIEDDDDVELPIWNGVLPLRLVPGAPVSAPPETATAPRLPVPAHVTGWRRPAPAKGAPAKGAPVPAPEAHRPEAQAPSGR